MKQIIQDDLLQAESARQEQKESYRSHERREADHHASNDEQLIQELQVDREALASATAAARAPGHTTEEHPEQEAHPGPEEMNPSFVDQQHEEREAEDWEHQSGDSGQNHIPKVQGGDTQADGQTDQRDRNEGPPKRDP